MNDQSLKTRREFLKSTILGGALTWTVPSFIQMTIRSLYAESDGALTQITTGKEGPILVVVQLAGGNDGLNTLVPFTNDFYRRARPTLAVPENSVLKLNKDYGFAPALSGLKALYDSGRLAIVHGVGYPNPNRSHFRSMEIWHTAADANRNEPYGWIGRYFDNQCPGRDSAVGIAISREAPQAFAARRPTGLAFQSPLDLGMIADGAGRRAEDEFFIKMNALESVLSADNAGGSIGSLSGRLRQRPGENPIDFLERTALDAQVNADRIRSILQRPRGRAAYPSTRLGRDLEMIARLIGGGMTTRVYYASQGGYDTHVQQRGAHDRLLRELGDALKAFTDDLAAQGNLPRVAVMTFSEFGRRVDENASGGTDHGAAAPVFIIGGDIKAGFHGRAPSLDPKHLDQGDLPHTVDFRSIYATLLEKHLRAPSGPILGRSYPLMNLM